MPVVPMRVDPGKQLTTDNDYWRQTNRQVIYPRESKSIIAQYDPYEVAESFKKPSSMAMLLATAEMHAEGKFEEAFDPEGTGYDYKTAKAAGLGPKPVEGDDKPHWPSRDPNTGVLLKGSKHPTFQLGVDEDAKLGYKMRKREDGRYVTEKDE